MVLNQVDTDEVQYLPEGLLGEGLIRKWGSFKNIWALQILLVFPITSGFVDLIVVFILDGQDAFDILCMYVSIYCPLYA